MNPASFQKSYEHVSKNIEEIKSLLKKKDDVNLPGNAKIFERAKYLLYGLLKSLVNIGNSIIIENDFRKPLNNVDVFISLAEHEIIVSSAIPGIKRAVLSMPVMSGCSYSEFFEIIAESIADLHKCLDSFAAYFSLINTEMQN